MGRGSVASTTPRSRSSPSTQWSTRAGRPACLRSRCSSRDDVYTSTTLAENECFLTVDDDDLGEVRVIRGYSEWDGVPPRRRAVMHAAGRDTDAVLSPDD